MARPIPTKYKPSRSNIPTQYQKKCPLFTGGEPEKYLHFFDIVVGFIRNKNIKTDTDELEVAIEYEQLQLDTHLALDPTGDVALGYATDSGAEDV